MHLTCPHYKVFPTLLSSSRRSQIIVEHSGAFGSTSTKLITLISALPSQVTESNVVLRSHVVILLPSLFGPKLTCKNVCVGSIVNFISLFLTQNSTVYSP